ncbi:MAG TPA: tRNA pseudouridine(55) synthase TruB [Candidatus Binatia bacterium]|nr:tRNA pseudouridine(55) synthase TruB [Candidatus Binatia bacterium]
MNGVIIIDKPAGWTSHDVVNRMRRILGQRSVGHLGTLDPLATGVLPLVTGSMTRLAQFYTTSEKTYEGVIRFGFATTTYDADGDPVGTVSSDYPPPDNVQTAAAHFRGVMEQMPPPFSAKKIHGVPAYKLARRQKEVELKPVQVEIKNFEILSVEGGRASFRARVASGTYMRSVAHDMGRRLECGAHLESLRRTEVAEFDLTQAHTLEEIAAATPPVPRYFEQTPVIKGCHSEPGQSRGEEPAFSAAALQKFFIHPRQLLPQLPSVTADDDAAARIRCGRPVNLPELSRARHVKVFYGQRELIAIATRVAGTLFHAKIVFATDPQVSTLAPG